MVISSAPFDRNDAGGGEGEGGEPSGPWERATESSDPLFTGLNAMPGSTICGQCPKGEATRLPAGSQETGSTTKLSTVHPFVQACPAHQENCCISRAASTAVLELLWPPRWKKAEGTK